MSKDVNVIRKNILAMLVLSTAIAVPLKSFAQDLPEFAPAENEMEAAGEDDMDINEVLQEIEDATPSNEVPQQSATQDTEILQVVPTPTEQVTQPATEQLTDPQAANEQAAIEQAENLPDIPSMDAEDNQDDGLFFDAEQIVPRSEIGRKSAPRRISPADEPGTRLIVVKKNYSTDSQKAEMVAAERAMKLGRYDAALAMYDAMYAKNKRDPNVLMGRAEAYQRLGQNDYAVQAYEELLEMRPKNVEARVNMLGLIGQKYPAVALRQLLDLREGNSGNVGIVAQIAVAKAALGEYGEAIRYLGIAASMEPNNPAHVFNMAVIADSAGDRDQAISLYEQALEVDTLYGKGASIPRDSIFERLASLR